MSLEPTADSTSTHRNGKLATKWKENHGSFLVGFVALVALINIAIVIYNQAKFVPIKFPGASAFMDALPKDSDQRHPHDQSICINVTGAPTMIGSVVIAVFDSSDDFNDLQRAVAIKTASMEDGIAHWCVDPARLPNQFAVLAFHDENGDDQITESARQVPIERYGFSTDLRYHQPGEPPKFEDAMIDKPAIGSTIELFIR